MADRSIVVRLKADVGSFNQQIGSASKSLDDFAKRGQGGVSKAQATMGQFAQSLRENSAEWGVIAGASAKAGLAILAAGAAVATTGVNYQKLQQTSRAALRTMLGGAEQANRQMDKLDEFARTSPFSKAVFIQAQQQMLAFGIETQKVIPYLDAIGEAVAAAGGSNQDIAELTRIFSQIQAASKITATDLMQFGQRGVDAASLIGSQMGMTGAQIREEITAGTLDAGQALDALAAGMQESFGGASANVKETLAGAFDRVTAAWRDLSATIMGGAVGTEGGGWLVGLTNALADFLRLIGQIPAPLLHAGAAMSALGGFGLVAFAGIIKATEGLISLSASLSTIAEKFPLVAARLNALKGAAGPLLLVVGGVVAVMSAMGEANRRAAAEISGLAETIDEATGSWTRYSREFALAELAQAGIIDGARELGIAGSILVDAYLDPASEAMQGLRQAAADADAEFQRLSNSTEYNKEALFAAQDRATGLASILGVLEGKSGVAAAALEEFAYNAEATGESTGQTAEEIAQLAYEQEALGPITDAAADAQDGLTDSSDTTTASLRSQRDALLALMDAELRRAGVVISAMQAEANWYQAVDRATEAVAKNGATLDVTTEAGRNNQSALIDMKRAADDHIQSLLDTKRPAAEVEAAMQRNYAEFVRVAAAMTGSAEEAENLARELGLIPSDVPVRIAVNYGTALTDIERIQQRLGAIPRQRQVDIIIKQYGQAAVATGGYMGDFAQKFANGGYPRRAGYIRGPGGPKDDLIPAMLSNREFVNNAESVEREGVDAFYALNAGRARIVRLASGGSPSPFYTPTPQPHMTAPRTAPVSVDGMRIQGTLALAGDGLSGYVDGVIREDRRRARVAS